MTKLSLFVDEIFIKNTKVTILIEYIGVFLHVQVYRKDCKKEK